MNKGRNQKNTIQFMYMSLRMIQKPPVIFTQYDPSGVIGRSELSLALGPLKKDALPWLWLSYGRSVLADADHCMEANEGAAATASLLSGYPIHSRINVRPMPDGYYELKAGDVCLFLSETEAGDVFLYFFSPEKYCNRHDEYRIDLTDFGSETAAYFIATLFDSYTSIVRLYEMN